MKPQTPTEQELNNYKDELNHQISIRIELVKALKFIKELLDNGELSVTSRSIEENMPYNLIKQALQKAEG